MAVDILIGITGNNLEKPRSSYVSTYSQALLLGTY